MRTFKNWKSELKKKGAMALTAFMLCGSAGTAFAQETTTPVIIHDASASGEIEGAGNVRTITGYQTDVAEAYAVQIDWGNMLFIYDRGTFDPSTGELVESTVMTEKDEFDAEGEPTGETTMVEASYSECYGRCYEPDSEEINGRKIGRWYGSKNRNSEVRIINLSTNCIYAKIAPTKDTSNNNLTDVSLRVCSSVEANDNNDKYTVLNGPENTTKTWDANVHPEWSEASEESKKQVKASTEYLECYLDAMTFNATGQPTHNGYWTRAYVHVSGTPKEGFRNKTSYEENGGEKIGEVTISFNKATKTDGVYTTGGTLNPMEYSATADSSPGGEGDEEI